MIGYEKVEYMNFEVEDILDIDLDKLGRNLINHMLNVNKGYKIGIEKLRRSNREIKFYSKKCFYHITKMYHDVYIQIDVYPIKDEWYYVNIGFGFKHTKYYKCDQIDGLNNCLQNEVFKKYSKQEVPKLF